MKFGDISMINFLSDDYQTPLYQGDLGFDPLGLKPSDPAAFNDLRTKELQNGRLAMLATAGFIAQELIDGKTVLSHLGL
jgi:Chlorophyll A-B binding protein